MKTSVTTLKFANVTWMRTTPAAMLIAIGLSYSAIFCRFDRVCFMERLSVRMILITLITGVRSMQSKNSQHSNWDFTISIKDSFRPNGGNYSRHISSVIICLKKDINQIYLPFPLKKSAMLLSSEWIHLTKWSIPAHFRLSLYCPILSHIDYWYIFDR